MRATQSALCVFRECGGAIQNVVVEMASIVNDPEATPEEREAAVATIAEALFPSGDREPFGIDLEIAGALGVATEELWPESAGRTLGAASESA